MVLLFNPQFRNTIPGHISPSRIFCNSRWVSQSSSSSLFERNLQLRDIKSTENPKTRSSILVLQINHSQRDWPRPPDVSTERSSPSELISHEDTPSGPYNSTRTFRNEALGMVFPIYITDEVRQWSTSISLDTMASKSDMSQAPSEKAGRLLRI